MSEAVLDPAIFRDYDIRAIVPEQLNSEGIKKIAVAIVNVFSPKSVQLGHDMRVSSAELVAAFKDTLLDLGVDVVDLGLISTDMLYFAAGTYPEDMAITISASHNPPEYNGLKIVKKGAIAVSGESGIYEIRDEALKVSDIPSSSEKGNLISRNIMNEFVNHVFSFVDKNNLGQFNVVVDAGNGMAGHFMPHIEKHLNWEVDHLYYELDGTFPNHIPSPLEEKNMQDVVKRVTEIVADFGLAFDGDGDRVFLVDEKGKIVSGTLMTAMIAEKLLEKQPGETVLYNAIVGRVVSEVVNSKGGNPVRVRVGHTIIKEKMREHNAIFCGEHSGHYYFRDNFYADSAIIAALLVAELMVTKSKKLSELVDEYSKYVSSGEINFVVDNKESVLQKIENKYMAEEAETDRLDGVSVWFKDWWFNVRPSNTEMLLRLNIEAISENLMKEKKDYLIQLLKGYGGQIRS